MFFLTIQRSALSGIYWQIQPWTRELKLDAQENEKAHKLLEHYLRAGEDGEVPHLSDEELMDSSV